MLVTDMNNEEFAMCIMKKRSLINLSSSSEMILIQTFMVWASMCFRVISSLYSVGQETYVNTYHHFDNVLKPFLRNDIHRLFPG